jgi:hypothetical protein
MKSSKIANNEFDYFADAESRQRACLRQARHHQPIGMQNDGTLDPGRNVLRDFKAMHPLV